jgi:hypothetical protein
MCVLVFRGILPIILCYVVTWSPTSVWRVVFVLMPLCGECLVCTTGSVGVCMFAVIISFDFRWREHKLIEQLSACFWVVRAAASAAFFLGLLLSLEYGDDIFIRKFGFFRTTRRYNPDDTFLLSRCRENLKSKTEIRSKSLWRRCITTNIMLLDFIHRPVFI